MRLSVVQSSTVRRCTGRLIFAYIGTVVEIEREGLEMAELHGWQTDPFGVHEQRYFSQGKPTKLVRDQGRESYDPPPGDESVARPSTLKLDPGSVGTQSQDRDAPPVASGPQSVNPPPTPPPGVGWWLASDGNWYPPEDAQPSSAPQPPPPPGPPAGEDRWLASDANSATKL